MKPNFDTPDAVEVDFHSPIFDTAVQDEDFETPVRITINPTPAAQQPKKPNGSVPSTAAAKPRDEGDDLLDLSDDATLDKLSSGGFLRLRPEGHNTIRVAFFKPAVHEKTHYVQSANKTFRCLQSSGAICCKHLGEARDVIGVLAVQYVGASPKDGFLKKGTDPDLRAGYMTLSKSAIVSMRKNLRDGETLYSVDWLVSKKTNGIGYEYVSRLPLAYKAMSLDKKVEELIAPYRDGVKLRQRAARPFSVAEVMTLVTGGPPEPDDSKLEDMETM